MWRVGGGVCKRTAKITLRSDIFSIYFSFFLGPKKTRLGYSALKNLRQRVRSVDEPEPTLPSKKLTSE